MLKCINCMLNCIVCKHIRSNVLTIYAQILWDNMIIYVYIKTLVTASIMIFSILWKLVTV